MADTQTDTGIATVSPVKQVEVDTSLQQIFEYLTQEGYRPRFDDDGSISFKCEGWNIYLDSYDSNGGFRAYCCALWDVDPKRTYRSHQYCELNQCGTTLFESFGE